VIEVTATVVGAAEVQAKFAGAADKARPLLRSRVQRLGLELLRKVKAEKLSGQVLHVQTGGCAAASTSRRPTRARRSFPRSARTSSTARRGSSDSIAL
jgi:hypothetical protein